MKRRSGLAVTFVALLTVGWTVVTTYPSDRALAADPQSELAETRAKLADAQSAQAALAATLDRQRSELSQLQQRSAALDGQLDLARAELAAVTAEFERVSGLLAGVVEQVAEIEARIAELQAQIAELDGRLEALARAIQARGLELAEREALLEDHLRSAYERSQTSLLEILLSADSLDQVTTQVGYLMTVSEQDASLADEVRTIREELQTQRSSLRDGRRALGEARRVARDEEAALKERRDELAALEARADPHFAWQQRRSSSPRRRRSMRPWTPRATLRATVRPERAGGAGRISAGITAPQSQAAAQHAAIEEARRRAAEEARRRAPAEGSGQPDIHLWLPVA